ncbi:unnamed protein product [Leptidea sinapis]|uniref:E3 SUMO-protein ligase RanBP2 n=1 Tax=Leptidea sinapis TaxID=189913 RepID=A0A5E4QAZ6_9NEOP|nr:unnamed protein product [Leptidea sinapis]
MYKNKKEVDKHVENLLAKLSEKDFKARAYSVARLYYDVGDFRSCQKYVEQYLTLKANNAAAHKLLGQTYLKLGQKENAFEEFKTSLELDPTQTSVIIEICELLSGDDITIDYGRAKYWCGKAEVTFPKHPITFKLKEKLLSVANSDPEALLKLLKSELSVRPRDAVLHVRLLKHYLSENKIKEAFQHSCNIEFGKFPFINNIAWYETLSEILKLNDVKSDMSHQLLLLTVKERLCMLSLTEVPQGTARGTLEFSENLLCDYDQAIYTTTLEGPPQGYAEFHNSLIQHHRGQIAFLAATFILKKAKKDQINWCDSTDIANVLMLISWQTVPIDPKANWLIGASENQKTAVLRWFLEGSYRCSQSGHFILTCSEGSGQLFLDKICRFCSGKNWKDKIYEQIFKNKKQSASVKSYMKSGNFKSPVLRLPRRAEVQAYDQDAQKQYPNSLHHFVWLLNNYKEIEKFQCTIFDMLTPPITSSGPETLNKYDVKAFMYCAALSAQQLKQKSTTINNDRPVLIPAHITDLLCTLPQLKWWDCAYKYSQNELGSEYTDIRSTLSRGIEVVRCVDNHGLDPELLCILGRIFSALAEESSNADDKNMLESRAALYYTSAIPLLEKIKSKTMIKLPAQRMFNYTHKEFETKELMSLVHECKLFMAIKHFNECDYVKTVEYLINLKSPEAYYYISESYKKIAEEDKNLSKNYGDIDSKFVALLRKSKSFAHKALDSIKEKDGYKSNPLDTTIDQFMEQTRSWFDENRKLGNQIISTINSNIENTTEQFKLLKISVDQVKDQIAECKNDCKDVADLKKQVSELQKEVSKLKKSSEQTIDESELYSLDEEYRSNDNAASFGAQMQFPTSHVVPPFNQRLLPPFPMPPNPYQLYGQNFYNLYNQYSQFAQPQSVPAAASLFDASRTQVNYPGVYPTPDQMYLDVAHLIPPVVQSAPAIIPTVTTLSTATTTAINTATTAVNSNKISQSLDLKQQSGRTLPVNVVITSSDPLPLNTSTPAPVLSVTIPQKHIKGSPHNYQIAMPNNNNCKTQTFTPPVFNFPSSTNERSTVLNWNTPFSNINNEAIHASDTSKTVVDGVFMSPAANTTLNKSRTLSEKSNTSIENYDPCPDFKPIVPLPAEVKVTTGEENETVVFSARAKLYRFVDKQWKERGIGEMKLLKHNVTHKVRVLMRREQVHKICANHIILPEMEIKPMKNETKAYFWVANDFAEETVILEKFCVRFKTADIAKEFYEQFEQAREATSVGDKANVRAQDASVKVIVPEAASNVENNQTNKTVVGGFTFLSTPMFKSVPQSSNAETKTETKSTNVSVFSSLNFKTTKNSLSNNVPNPFDTKVNSQNIESSVNNESLNISSISNKSDIVEDFEPLTEFKPVIPLPALAEQKTGEENETILFEHRAKLLRFDSDAKEWKERGLGNMKLLKDNESNKLRLLMRREQILKICCNHAVTKEMVFKKMPSMDKAVTWCAKDFSENELVPETFCLRFKTVEVCDDFMKVLQMAQSKLDMKEKFGNNTEQKTEINSKESSFGAQFKPKAGSWNCSSCYANNDSNSTKCACCENPNPQIKIQNDNSTWGDLFKPQQGTWECKQCLIRNQKEKNNCNACNSPRDPSIIPKPESSTNTSVPQFKFGIPSQVVSISEPVSSNSSALSEWANKFQPKEGTWECKQCAIRNNKEKEKCESCGFQNPDIVQTEKISIFGNTMSSKFSFQTPQPSLGQKIESNTNNLNFNNVGTSFKFGISNLNDNNVSTDKNDISTPLTAKSETQNLQIKPALLPTPEVNSTLTFGSKDGGTFDFSLKPKSPNKSKSPAKTPRTPKDGDGDDSGDEECPSDDEGRQIYFSPVIPMPDKVDVVTGEENETELYGHRAKLFLFSSGEWKERGLGIVKILKSKVSGALRVLMRREQVLKICLNHILTPDIIYKPKDDKTWLFAANDYSEGELQLQQFCLRFQNNKIALEFKDELDKAIKDKFGDIVKINDGKLKDTDSEDVVFVSEVQASSEEKQVAKDLMLPENFHTYKNKDPCQGCRGCDEDSDEKSDTTLISDPKDSLQAKDGSSPDKNNQSEFTVSETNSMYGTPVAGEKSFDTSIFRTPMGNTGSGENYKTIFGFDNTKTDTKTPQNIFSGFNLKQPSFGPSVNEQSSTKPVMFGNVGFGQTPTSSFKSSILAAPKLCANAGDKEVTPKSIFGSSASKSTFSETNNIFKSGFLTSNVFGSIPQNQIGDTKKSETPTQTMFSQDNSQPINLFANIQSNTSGIFNQGNTFKFGIDKNTNIAPVLETKSEAAVNLSVDPVTIKGVAPEVSIVDAVNKNSEEAPILKVDSNLSFAALSTPKNPEFTIEKKPDFKWEGQGQQLFANKNNTTLNSSEAENTSTNEEEYDPHYEPIVPLPEIVTVTTGEEDEEKIFGERCKLFRFDETTREWKERGVGEMKILYHTERKTYRLLLRREQVHKAVLNMLIIMDFELLPMKNSDRAWTWAGVNYADSSGEQEMLAVRFKSVELANKFRDTVLDCVHDKENADESADSSTSKHVEFLVAECDYGEEENCYSPEEEDEDSLGYYNEDEEYYDTIGEVLVEEDGIQRPREWAAIKVLFDCNVCSPKIQITSKTATYASNEDSG